jgi:hypothetical protein
MKEISRFSLCIVVMVVSLTLCAAQEQVEISTNPPPPMIKLPIVKEVGSVQVVYNARTDKTIVQTHFVQVQGDWRHGILMQASFDSPGKIVIKPSKVTLTFSSAADTRVYADHRQLKISLDGEQTLSEVARYERGNTNGAVYLITVKQEIPYDLFLRICDAKSVKIQTGPTEFALRNSDLSALRDVAKAIE